MLALALAPAANAQEPLTELWSEYPLDPTAGENVESQLESHEALEWTGLVPPAPEASEAQAAVVVGAAASMPDAPAAPPWPLIGVLGTVMLALLLLMLNGAIPIPSVTDSTGTRRGPASAARRGDRGGPRRPRGQPRARTSQELELSVIDYRHGHLKGRFYARAVDREGREYVAARSPVFAWIHSRPPEPTRRIQRAHLELVERLLREGWQLTRPNGLSGHTEEPHCGRSWYERRLWRPHREPARAPLARLDEER